MARWFPRVTGLTLLLLLTGCTSTGSSNVRQRARQVSGVQHTVKPGENLFRIALYYYETTSTSETLQAVERIKQANGLRTEILSAGQKLFIPGTHKQQPRHALLPPTSPSPSVPAEKPPRPSPQPPPEKVPLLKQENFIWPVEGKVICRYGELDNKGIDILTTPGAVVVASREGRVSFAGQTSKYGETVIIEHADSTYTVYGHDFNIKVAPGRVVKQGETIGQVKDGSQKLRYLHFEIRRGQGTVDPLQVLPEKTESR